MVSSTAGKHSQMESNGRLIFVPSSMPQKDSYSTAAEHKDDTTTISHGQKLQRYSCAYVLVNGGLTLTALPRRTQAHWRRLRCASHCRCCPSPPPGTPAASHLLPQSTRTSLHTQPVIIGNAFRVGGTWTQAEWKKEMSSRSRWRMAGKQGTD